MEILLAAGYTALFLFLIHRWKFFRPEIIPVHWVKVLFVTKVISGCLLGLVYTYYYTDRSTADTFKFFDDSKILFGTLFSSPREFLKIFFGIHDSTGKCFEICSQMTAWNNKDVLFNDNKTLVRLNVFFHFFSLGYYYVHVVFLNFFSFTGMIALFRVFQHYERKKSKIIFLAMMFLPSVLFWGSGLLKDGLLLFALGILLYSFNNLITSQNFRRNIIVFSLSLVLLLFTKLYVLFIISPALIAWYWSRNNTGRIVLIKFISCYLIYLFIGFNIDKVSEKYDLVDLIYYKQQNFNVLATTSRANSFITIPNIEATAWSLLMNSPSAVWRVFIRPNIFDSGSLLIRLSSIENILILTMGIFCIFFADRKMTHSLQLFCLSIFFVLFMFALIGLITPILGAMVRYKVPALLFLVFIFISIADGSKLKSKFPVMQKLL